MKIEIKESECISEMINARTYSHIMMWKQKRLLGGFVSFLHFRLHIYFISLFCVQKLMIAKKVLKLV